MLNEYRVTRPGLYTDDGIPNPDIQIRQGYYVAARSELEATALFRQRLEGDGYWTEADTLYGLDVELLRRAVVPHELSSGTSEC